MIIYFAPTQGQGWAGWMRQESCMIDDSGRDHGSERCAWKQGELVVAAGERDERAAAGQGPWVQNAREPQQFGNGHQTTTVRARSVFVGGLPVPLAPYSWSLRC